MREEAPMLHAKGRSRKGLIEIFRYRQPLGIPITLALAKINGTVFFLKKANFATRHWRNV